MVVIRQIPDQVIDAADLFLAKRNELGNIAFQSFPEEACLVFPNEYLVFTASPEDINNRYFAQNPEAFIRMEVPTYDDRSDAVVLLANNSEIIDELLYDPDFHNELLSDFNGVSLERINPNAATQSDENWHSAASSVGYATPTYQNSQFVPLSSNPGNQIIDIPNKTLSPDDDGFEDVLLINYQTNDPGFVATLNIYDSRGRLVNNLIQNEILATQGNFKWDGTNNDREKVRIGIYIITGELVNPNGNIEAIKESVVVAGRLD